MHRWRAASVVVTMMAVMPCAAPTLVWAQEPVTAFEHVAVVPMDRERMLHDQTVIVRGSRIVALGPAAKTRVPNGAVRIDGQGKFLMPGLGDMHAHMPGFTMSFRHMMDSSMPPAAVTEAEQMLFLYLAGGVTTVRVMVGWHDGGTLRLRERAARGELLSPRIYAASMWVGFGVTPDSAMRIARDAKAAGYDLIKLYGVYGPELDSLAVVAHRIDIPIAGHAPHRDSLTHTGGLEQALQVGYASIEHLTGFAAYLTGGANDSWVTDSGQPRPLDEAKLRSLVAELRRKAIWNCPTLLINESRAQLLQEPELRYAGDSALAQWKYLVSSTEYNWSDKEVGVERRRQIVRALRDGGGGLLLGTDAGVPLVLPGFSAHRELAALVRAGLTPYEALATGTRNVAAYLGTLDSTGTVTVGKRADLVLLDGNPLERIEHTGEIAGVMLGGRWLSRAELDRRLAAIEHTLQ